MNKFGSKKLFQRVSIVTLHEVAQTLSRKAEANEANIK